MPRRAPAPGSDLNGEANPGVIESDRLASHPPLDLGIANLDLIRLGTEASDSSLRFAAISVALPGSLWSAGWAVQRAAPPRRRPE